MKQRCFLNKRVKRFFLFVLMLGCLHTTKLTAQHQVVSFSGGPGYYPLVDNSRAAVIRSDSADYAVVQIATIDLRRDLEAVTGKPVRKVWSGDFGNEIIIGTLGHSQVVDELVNKAGLDLSSLKGQWEKFMIQVVDLPDRHLKHRRALAIIGSDRRGTAYGVYELSKQIGVSPWHYFADVPTVRHKEVYIKQGSFVFGPPSIQYRGIFINDEGIGLGRWARRVFDPKR